AGRPRPAPAPPRATPATAAGGRGSRRPGPAAAGAGTPGPGWDGGRGPSSPARSRRPARPRRPRPGDRGQGQAEIGRPLGGRGGGPPLAVVEQQHVQLGASAEGPFQHFAGATAIESTFIVKKSGYFW